MCVRVPQRRLEGHLRGRERRSALRLNPTTPGCSPWAPKSQKAGPVTGRAGGAAPTFRALAVLLGGTFSFCEGRSTGDLPLRSGGANRKSQLSARRSAVTFSSLGISRLILERQE